MLDEQSPILMTTLPYDAHYTVKIDGKVAETTSVEGLLAVKAPLGTHTVSIARPASIGIETLPLCIGLGGMPMAVILLFLQKNKRKQAQAK